MAISTRRSRAQLLGKIGGHTAHSRHDSRRLTEHARAAFLRRFEDEIDSERVLPAEERQRRAGQARKAYFARLALASADARRNRALLSETNHTKDGAS